MAPSDFASADIDEVVEAFTNDEAILLTAGVGLWHTYEIERLGILAIKVSDGRGTEFFGNGTVEERGTYPLEADTKYDTHVEFCSVRGPADGDEGETVTDDNADVRLGGTEIKDADAMMAEAVNLAKEADTVVAIVGLNGDWETEGADRITLALPGRTDELISKVAAVDSNTVVGSSITMPCVHEVPGIVHAWYLGSSTGEAITDVLFGKHNPSVKLPLTFPKAEEDIPSFGHFHSENGEVRYAEDLFIGTNTVKSRPSSHLAFVSVTNTSSVSGSETVQLYISLPVTSNLTHPPLQLKAFSKVQDLQPGKSEVIVMRLDKYAVSYWEEQLQVWTVEKGEYHIRVGRSSDSLPLEKSFTLTRGFE